jgi:UDP-N-acetylglucosamine--N-acetylmuramyl-(pentapeptide) pyrophosphoryl-undecaprenol N-acetylglucosamine transferase
MRVIFAGGGTAGHINPAIAVAKYIKKNHKGAKILFIGTKRGLEKTLVPKEGFEIKFIDVAGLKRSPSPKNLVSGAKAFMAYLASKGIIKKFMPDIVIGTGGYVSAPVLAAAAKMGIPTLIHEQNVSPGLTSKMLSGMVDTVCVSFEESKSKFPKAKNIVCTGNPLREELFRQSAASARKKLNLDDRPFIVAFGGSLGAKKINDSILSFIVGTKDRCDFQILMATGKGQYGDVLKFLKENNITRENFPHIRVVEYIHNMDEVLNAADIVVARAGAITISEITALGKAAVLIPSPNVTDNHQEYNARALEDRGAAIVFTEKELSEETFARTIMELAFDREILEKMSKNSFVAGIKDGTEKIYTEIQKLLKNK